MPYTLSDLENLVNSKLDMYSESGQDMPNVYRRLQSPDGRSKVFRIVMDLITKQGIKDVDAAIATLEQVNE